MDDNFIDLEAEFDDNDEEIEGNEDYIFLTKETKLIVKKITLPVMTRYEKSVIISARIRQLDNGFKSTIEGIVSDKKLERSFDIAMMEFSMDKLPPYTIKRNMPDGRFEIWQHSDFKYFP